MKIIQIISEHKRRFRRNGNKPPQSGYKRIMAIIEEHGILKTRHLDIPNN